MNKEQNLERIKEFRAELDKIDERLNALDLIDLEADGAMERYADELMSIMEYGVPIYAEIRKWREENGKMRVESGKRRVER